MNKKYLFGMLVSGALLTACTADDALDAAKVNKDVNMSAPVFTVSIDNGDLQNRAHYAPGNAAGNKVNFDPGDKMSLYHGFASDLSDLSGWQNAIYLAAEEDEDGNMDFSTQAMVQRGCAIMVYPADLGFGQMSSTTNTGAAAPKVFIDQVQDKTQKDRTPYMTNFLLLADPSAKDQAAYAGYGETYDIKMRRAAGTLRVQLDKDKEPTVNGAAALEVRAVEIEYPNTTFFSVAVPIKAGDQITDRKNGMGRDHKSWEYQAELDLESDDIVGKPSLKTKDVENDIATFTILPTKTKSWTDLPTNGSVRVYTNYGIATIGTAEEVFGADEDAPLDGADQILYQLTQKLWITGETGKTEFVGQTLGAPVSTKMYVDMSKLTLDKMHIDNEADLITALQVYDALYTDKKDEDIVITLDGTSKKFKMSAETLKKVSDHMVATANNSNKGLKFAACNISGEALDVIEVTSDTEFEVPSLIFENGKTVKVNLAGKWKWTAVTNLDESKGNKKYMTNVTDVVFLKGAVVTLANNIAVKNGGFTNGGITINYGATANVNTMKTDVYVQLLNKGVINVGEDGELRAASNAGIVENCAEEQDDDDTVTGLTTTQYGLINNYGILGVDHTNPGKINNYGVVDIKSTDASTLVSTNANTAAKITSWYGDSDTNFFGTILIDNARESMTTVEGAQGFIKKSIAKTNPAAKEIGTLANYIILKQGCKGLTSADVADPADATKKVAGLPTEDGGATGIKYVELETTEIVYFTGAEEKPICLQGLIVPEGRKLKIEDNCEVKMNKNNANIYLKGSITNAGNLRSGGQTKNVLDSGIFKGYFGEGNSDITTVK